MTEVARLPAMALAQMEVQPGRPDLNLERMAARIDEARRAGAELIAFPEMCLTGYIIGDLWEVDALVLDFAAYSDQVRLLSEAITVVFGNVAVDPRRVHQDGRLRKYNAVWVCRDCQYVDRPGLPPGLPVGTQPKTLHPNYRFFDDDRHFFSLRQLAAEEARPLADWVVPFVVPRSDGGQFAFGVQLCEDLWCDDYRCQGEAVDTLQLFHQRQAQAVINLSSSPWTWQKSAKRHRVVAQTLRRSPVPLLYVNQVGAQNNGKNIIVFDGDTSVYDAQAHVVRRARPWADQLVLTRGDDPVPSPQSHLEAVRDAVIAGIRHLDFVRGQATRYLIGVSGGIDSSLVACLLTLAVGPERVQAVNMPTHFNAAVTRDNAARLCGALAIEHLSVPIQDLYESLAAKIQRTAFASGPGRYTSLVDENLQARIRGADILPAMAAQYGAVFTNNGNKTEVALGYATLYGDVNGAIAPIADLYKTDVIALARFLNEHTFGTEVVPENLISGQTVPSAELSAAQDVTKGLGDPIKYGYHDAVLRQLIEYRRHPADLLQWYADGQLLERLGWHEAARFQAWFADARAWVHDLEWVARQLRLSYFKRVQAPPIVVLSKRAFGFDLRESQLPDYTPVAYHRLRAHLLGS